MLFRSDVIVADGRGVRDLQFVDTAGNHGDGFVQLVAGCFMHAVVTADLVQLNELLLLGIDLCLQGSEPEDTAENRALWRKTATRNAW